MALDRLIHHHAEDRVGLVKVGTDGENNVTLLDLREGSRRGGHTQRLLQTLGQPLVTLPTGVVDVAGTETPGKVFEQEYQVRRPPGCRPFPTCLGEPSATAERFHHSTTS
jgi:hypothetical protein